ncbi:MAG: DUF72 domain-containing protein [Burkholderiales bacterium]|nr:DUF72 domain-containing protein [Burkholderiales bacterium]ODU71449.1 MAG: hypothetical protein ABT05_01130 [Lautropia sp. SCN 66-9]
MSRAAAIRVGVSGWRYAPWRGDFYPEGLRQADELHYASRQLPAIEINGSFYSLQTPASYRAWYAATPRGFAFSVKGPRYLTHILRLREIDKPLANFFASGLFELKEKLGAILWQFPPSLRWNAELFERFCAALPRNTGQAQALARRREARMKGRCSLAIDRSRRLRHAVEIRHDSFLNEAFIALLRRHGIALVIADTGRRWPEIGDLTADFLYLRLHGATQLYRSRYSEASLRKWAQRIEQWSQGQDAQDVPRISTKPPRARTARDVFCFFDNTDKQHAPRNAQRMLALLGHDAPMPARGWR